MGQAARRSWPVGVALVVALFLLGLFHSVRRYDPGAAAVSPPSVEECVLSADDAVMISRVQGVSQWRLHVGRIALRRAPEAELTEFHAADFVKVSEGVLYKDGAPRITFAAEQATYSKILRQMDVRGNIALRSASGDSFSSDHCLWTESEEYVRFPGGARAVIEGDTITAPQMLYATRLRVVRCPQGATLVVRNQTITAATLDWDVEARSIRCGGPVAGKRGDMDFVAERAELDLKARTIRVNKGTVKLRMDMQ